MFDARDRYFLDLLDDDLYPSYSKGGLWIKYFGHSNFLCMGAIRAIVNHASIEEYHLCFFPNKDFGCLCGNYLIESKHHILYDCRRFNNY